MKIKSTLGTLKQNPQFCVLILIFFPSPIRKPGVGGGGRWGIKDDFTTSFLHYSVLHYPLGLGELP